MAGRLAPRLRELRLAAGLSQRLLAEPEYTRPYLSMIEAGRASPAPEALRYFASRLGLPEALANRLRQARRDLCAGRVGVAREAYREMETDAELFALADLQAQARCGLAETFLHIGEFDTALEILTATPGTQAVARRVTCLALAGAPMRAIALAERHLATGGPDARLQAAIIMPHNHIGAYAQMNRAADHALALTPSIADDDLLAYVYRAVTHAFIHERRFDAALDYGRRALALFTACDLPSEQGLCHLAIANALQEDERLIEAAAELDSAVTLLSGSAYQARAAAVLADVHRRLGNAGRALEIARAVPDADPWSRAHLHRTIGLATDSEPELRRSVELFAAQGARHDALASSRDLGRLLTRQGRHAEAVDVYHRGLLIRMEKA